MGRAGGGHSGGGGRSGGGHSGGGFSGGGRSGGGFSGSGRSGGGHSGLGGGMMGGANRGGAGTPGGRGGMGAPGPGGGNRPGGMGGPGGMNPPPRRPHRMFFGGFWPFWRRGGYAGGYYRGGGCGGGCLLSIIIAVLVVMCLFAGIFSYRSSQNTQTTVVHEENHENEHEDDHSSNSSSGSSSSREKADTALTIFDSNCIVDEAGLLEDVKSVGENLEEFFDATGVQPYVYLKAYDDSLTSESQKYAWAEDWYEDNIGNEGTFLFVYFDEEDENANVYWSCVCGYDIDTVMDEEARDIFWEYVDEYWYSNLDLDEAIPKIFSATAEAIM